MVGREILVILFGAITTIGLFYIFREYSFGLDYRILNALLGMTMLSFIFKFDSMRRKRKAKEKENDRSSK